MEHKLSDHFLLYPYWSALLVMVLKKAQKIECEYQLISSRTPENKILQYFFARIFLCQMKHNTDWKNCILNMNIFGVK